MNTIMEDQEIKTFEDVKTFLKGAEKLTLKAASARECYPWIEGTLVKFSYVSLRKKQKSLIRKYIRKMTGYSRSQVTRLIEKYVEDGKILLEKYERNSFARIYSEKDIGLLAKTDQLHNNLNGPGIKKILERERLVFGKKAYANISQISVAHLYNLRRTKTYLSINQHYEKTKPTVVKIGERAKPRPNGRPGYIRIDTVHQGDKEKEKGVYHINAVDEAIQWQIMASLEKISEAYLVPVLEKILSQFPFVVIEFHSDNGSEYVNQHVANLLNKLLIRFTKSRARRTNDNALVECKNGAVIRKHLGYSHIPQKYAHLINEFNEKFLNYYVNFHRPCFFAKISIDKKGKQKKTYPYKLIKTPYEKLKSLPDAKKYLKPNISFKELDALAHEFSDNEFAERMVEARLNLFQKIDGRR